LGKRRGTEEPSAVLTIRPDAALMVRIVVPLLFRGPLHERCRCRVAERVTYNAFVGIR